LNSVNTALSASLILFPAICIHSHFSTYIHIEVEPVSKIDAHLEHQFPSRKLNCCVFRAETSKNKVRTNPIFQFYTYVHPFPFICTSTCRTCSDSGARVCPIRRQVSYS
jgi:hypothetical protein